MSRKLKNFDEVIGHKSLVEFLKKHVEDDNIVDIFKFLEMKEEVWDKYSECSTAVISESMEV